MTFQFDQETGTYYHPTLNSRYHPYHINYNGAGFTLQEADHAPKDVGNFASLSLHLSAWTSFQDSVVTLLITDNAFLLLSPNNQESLEETIDNANAFFNIVPFIPKTI